MKTRTSLILLLIVMVAAFWIGRMSARSGGDASPITEMRSGQARSSDVFRLVADDSCAPRGIVLSDTITIQDSSVDVVVRVGDVWYGLRDFEIARLGDCLGRMAAGLGTHQRTTGHVLIIDSLGKYLASATGYYPAGWPERQRASEARAESLRASKDSFMALMCSMGQSRLIISDTISRYHDVAILTIVLGDEWATLDASEKRLFATVAWRQWIALGGSSAIIGGILANDSRGRKLGYISHSRNTLINGD